MEMEYREYLNSQEWQEKRNERLRMDGFRCQRCGRPFDFEVHHITYKNLFHEDVATDLITLCKNCHKKIEEEKKIFKANQINNYYAKQEALVNLFIEKYKSKDVIFGGKENMCNREVIKKYWREMYGNEKSDVAYVTPTINYFRDEKIRFIHRWKEQGAEKDNLRRLGISEQMINKYWNK